MRLKINLPLKPMSVNKANRAFTRQTSKGAFSTTIKSKEYRKFEKDFEHHISKDKDNISVFSNMINAENDSLKVTYSFIFPKDKFYTKKGKHSKLVGDYDNFIKPIQDCLFKEFKKYNDLMDDYMIFSAKVEKKYGENYRIDITIEVLENNGLDRKENI